MIFAKKYRRKKSKKQTQFPQLIDYQMIMRTKFGSFVFLAEPIAKPISGIAAKLLQ